MLWLENVSSGYDSIEVLHDISLVVNQGEIISIIGVNGAGKSTLLRTVSGLLPCKLGRIFFENEEISRYSPDRIAGLNLIQVPEGRHVFAPLTVFENLLLGTYSSRRKLGKSEKERLFRFVFDLFPILVERKKQIAGTLSGGQQQMLALGRALMAQPKLLMLDEPTLGLAPVIIGSICRLIQELNRQGITILLVEQNAMIALTLAQRAYVLDTGRIALQGEAGDLLCDNQVRKIYMAEEFVSENDMVG
jgi:branched-chain amino acid transport system ATP-binding protein